MKNLLDCLGFLAVLVGHRRLYLRGSCGGRTDVVRIHVHVRCCEVGHLLRFHPRRLARLCRSELRRLLRRRFHRAVGLVGLICGHRGSNCHSYDEVCNVSGYLRQCCCPRLVYRLLFIN